MVAQSASMKLLLDVGVSEPVARRLADGRKWDDVVNLTFHEWLAIGKFEKSNVSHQKAERTMIVAQYLYNKVQDVGSKASNTASAQAALDRFSQWLVTAKHGNYASPDDTGFIVDDFNVWLNMVTSTESGREDLELHKMPRAGFEIIPERSAIDEEEPNAFLHGNKVHLGVWRYTGEGSSKQSKTFYERNGRYIPYFELDTWYYIDFSSETEPMPEFDAHGKPRWPEGFVEEGSKHHYLVRWRKSHFGDHLPQPSVRADLPVPSAIQPWKGELQQISLASEIGTPWGFLDDGLGQSSRGGVVTDSFGWASEPILIHKIPNTTKFLGVINYPFTSMD